MRVGIALGGNLGDRLAHLQKAVAFLTTLATPGQPFLVSSAYETAPVNCPPDSPLFFNAAVEMDYEGEPLELLKALQAFEARSGRPLEHPKNAPREIDLDILYCDNMAFTHPSLIVPHPHIAERFFVLKPLSEICPDRVLPGQGATIAELLRAMEPETVRRHDLQ